MGSSVTISVGRWFKGLGCAGFQGLKDVGRVDEGSGRSGVYPKGPKNLIIMYLGYG